MRKGNEGYPDFIQIKINIVRCNEIGALFDESVWLRQMLVIRSVGRVGGGHEHTH